jgi:hypothetical protein
MVNSEAEGSSGTMHRRSRRTIISELTSSTFAQRTSGVTLTNLNRRPVRQVCPCYRLPQLTPGRALADTARLPVCTALEEPLRVSHEQATRLCRSGQFPSCERFRIATPGRQATGSFRVGQAFSGFTTVAESTSVSRQLITSAAWVIGIPTAITLLILLAIWITENVWMPTEAAFTWLSF